ncbi:MMPL family transporter [Phytohabitans houttuyneae]|uniref:Membrane protein n=1 Tax=Phytohabitans houttuyneae TaxID=1076126 RepID=A0A6V8KPE3_9ACTN|nr:MMPL family transporter [Phytohabitans houttuyneae]GFJ84241.1 membrane protein [Phytohabitans houttuyneae]
MNAFTRRLGTASARRPWLTIAAWLVAATAVIALAGTAGGAFADDFVAPGSQSEQAMELLEERFPEAAGGSALAVFAAPDGQRLDAHRAGIEAAVARIAATERVTAVADPFTAGTVSADGRIGYAEISFDTPAMRLGAAPFDAIDGALEPARRGGLAAELGGDAAFINAETPSSGAELAGIVAALVVLLVAFGTVVAALLPIVLALVVVAAGVSGIALLASATEVSTVAPTIAAMIGLGVGIDYALFITARYRENRATAPDNRTALADAMGSAGSAVLFASGTIVVAMSALALTGMGFLTSTGLSTALVVVAAALAALTLLPALLALLGDRIDRGRLPLRRRREPGAGWHRLARHVSGRPWAYLLAATALLLALAAPALWMKTGFPDAGDDATSLSHRRAYDLLAEGFGPGVNGPVLVVVDLRAPGATAGDVAALSGRIAADPGVASVGAPLTSPAGDTAVLRVTTTTAPGEEATSATLERVRDLVPANAAVSGLTAMTDDLSRHLGRMLPVFVGAILAASFLLLMLVFRSVVVPLKAVLMNLLSIGGAYGVMVAVFQWGWGKSLLGLEETLIVPSPLPTIFFAVLFGLSMDYEVFLLSRIREAYDASGDTVASVARGIAATGRVITSAALIMAAVFLAFVANPSPFARMLGLGLATAVLLDATVVRLLLVPALMTLLGRANWWLPRWLHRRIPRLSYAPSRS